ncbi:hypothetical protein GW17_00047927 [Ensete ventricosum]|nr:hypothetical protein GW17_00047927 [Ensete ventricosum]
MDAAERRIQSPPVVVFITLTRGGLRRWAESNPMAEPTDWPRAGARYRVAGRRVGLNSAEGGVVGTLWRRESGDTVTGDVATWSSARGLPVKDEAAETAVSLVVVPAGTHSGSTAAPPIRSRRGRAF